MNDGIIYRLINIFVCLRIQNGGTNHVSELRIKEDDLIEVLSNQSSKQKK